MFSLHETQRNLEQYKTNDHSVQRICLARLDDTNEKMSLRKAKVIILRSIFLSKMIFFSFCLSLRVKNQQKRAQKVLNISSTKKREEKLGGGGEEYKMSNNTNHCEQVIKNVILITKMYLDNE